MRIVQWVVLDSLTRTEPWIDYLWAGFTTANAGVERNPCYAEQLRMMPNDRDNPLNPSPAPPPAADDPKPDAADPPVFAPALLKQTLANVPELEQFESDDSRRRALAEVGRKAGDPRSGGFWLGVLIFAAAVFLASVGGGLVIRRLGLGGLYAEAAVIVLCALVAWFVLRRLHRGSMPQMLRDELLIQGVPVCVHCGYSLRGLTPEAQRCPECGRAFGERVRAILEEARES